MIWTNRRLAAHVLVAWLALSTALGTSCSVTGHGNIDRATATPWSSMMEIAVKPDDFQFYASGDGTWREDEPSLEGYRRHLWSAGGFIYLGTGTMGGWTSVTFKVLDHPPGRIDETAQHVAETSIESTGVLEVRSWDATPGQVPADGQMEVPRGSLRVRVTWWDLDALDNASPDTSIYADTSPERIQVELWQAAASKPHVLRWWTPWQDQ